MLERSYEIPYWKISQFMHDSEDFTLIFERDTLGICHHRDSTIHLFQRGGDDSPLKISVYAPTSQREKEILQSLEKRLSLKKYEFFRHPKPSN